MKGIFVAIFAFCAWAEYMNAVLYRKFLSLG